MHISGDKELGRGDGPGGMALRTGPSVDVTGEAVTNNRKGKLIPSYELHIKGTFSGEAGGSGGEAAARSEGRWELPYLAEENADEDPELRATARAMLRLSACATRSSPAPSRWVAASPS